MVFTTGPFTPKVMVIVLLGVGWLCQQKAIALFLHNNRLEISLLKTKYQHKITKSTRNTTKTLVLSQKLYILGHELINTGHLMVWVLVTIFAVVRLCQQKAIALFIYKINWEIAAETYKYKNLLNLKKKHYKTSATFT